MPWVSRENETTLTAIAGPNLLTIHTPAPLSGKDLKTQGHFTVRAGEAVPFVLTYSPSDGPSPLPLSVEAALASTEKFWKGWTGKCKVTGKWSADIRRSLITLKALSYQPTGGIVAGSHDIAARTDRRVSVTGTTATAGCATRRSRYSHS